MALYDYDNLKALLDLDEDDISSYPALEFLADNVQARIADYLGRDLESVTQTESVRIRYGSATREIPLRALPVASVSSVTIDGAASADYEIAAWGLELGAAVSDVTVAVAYTGGYAAAPGWLTRALTLQIAYEWQNRDHIGADFVTQDGGSVGRPALQLLPEVRKTLDVHRHPAALF